MDRRSSERIFANGDEAHREFSASGPLVSRHCDGTRLLTSAATDLGYLRRLSNKDFPRIGLSSDTRNQGARI
jgi:hypothetical protein